MNKNDSKKNKIKVNVFDVVVILLVILLVGTLIYRIYSGSENEALQNGTKYVIYFESNDVYDSLIAYLEDGDTVYLENGEVFGFLYSESDESGVVYELIDDIPTYADSSVSEGSQDNSDIGEGNIVFVESSDENISASYRMINIGGNIRLSHNAVRVQKGNYFSIGDKNITEGSVVKVYTEDVEFTLVIKDIAIAE